MSEEGSSEASGLDAQSVTLDVDDLHKLIKETVHEDLTSLYSEVLLQRFI